MPYMNPMENWTLKFSELIIHEIQNHGFVSNIIIGERRRGKSIYVLKNFAKVYKVLTAEPDEECYKKALDCFIFGPDNLRKKIQYNTSHDIISEQWCIDDATVHFNPMMFFVNPYSYALLGGLFDTIGTATHCIALTCPKKKRLMPGLKNYDDYTTQITRAREGGYERHAKGVFWYTWPDQTSHWRVAYDDRYSCYVPDYIYLPYLEIRKKYLSVTNDLFTKLSEKLEREHEKRFSGLDMVKADIKNITSEINDEMTEIKEIGDGTI
jgi:hypothetical protein